MKNNIASNQPVSSAEKSSINNQKNKSRDLRGIMVRASSLALLFGAAYLVYVLQGDFNRYNLHGLDSTWELAFLAVTGSLLLFRAGFFFYNLYLYLRYKPINSVSNEELPTCTVIVPAYNEGKQVWATLNSLAKSD